MFIYIVCENGEVINKRCNYGYDYLQNKTIDLQKEETDRMIYTIFSSNPMETSELPEGFLYMAKYDSIGTDYSNRYDLLKLPHDFKSSAMTQLERYHSEALITIDKHALMHDPQYVIRVDGRVSPCRMFYTIKLRLDTLPFQKPFVPELLNQPEEPVDIGEATDIVEKLDFEGIPLNDCFEILSRKNIASPMFKWSLSDWSTKCPVYMRDGIYIDGDPKYAVHFMNKIFFLADERAFLNFYRNPRPYLLPPFPKLSSKIYVMGPKLLATQAVAKCLGYMLDVKVLYMDQLQNQFLKRKKEEIVETERSKAFEEIVEKLTKERLEEYEQNETNRNEKLNGWREYVMKLIHGYCKCIKEFVSDEIRKELESYNIDCPCIIDEIKENPDSVLKYAPRDLITPHIYKEADVKDEEVLNYVNNVVNSIDLKRIELTLDDLIEIYMTAIKDIEENDTKAGWILCGMLPNLNLLNNIIKNYPDEAFILHDNSTDHDFLVDRFRLKNLVEFHDFKGFFLDLGKKDVACRCPYASTLLFRGRTNDDYLKPILEYASDDSEELTEEEFFSYYPRRAAIDNFIDELCEYDVEIIKAKELLESHGVSCNDLNVAYKPIRALLTDVVNTVDNKFRQRAKNFTAEDREEELKDFGEPFLIGEDEEGADEEEEEEINVKEVEDSFLKNRRYGDTYYYCPVAFKEKFILWHGKDEFGAKFENKIYFLHSEDALERFIADPKSFLFKDGPPHTLPPPRICITGLPGSGKTTIAKRLARNLGLYYGNFLNLINKVSKEELSAYISNGDAISEETLNKVLLPYWFQEPKRSIGFVLDDFPRRASDIDYMIEYLTIPDMIIDLTAMSEILAERLKIMMLDDRKRKIEDEKANKDKINEQLMEEWRENMELQIKEILDEMRQRRYDKEREENNEMDEGNDIVEEDEMNVVRVSSQISYNSIADEQELAEARRIAEEKYPRPHLLEFWPNEEQIVSEISDEIEANYNLELQLFSGLKDICNTQSIPWTAIDANLDVDKTFAQVMKLVEGFKYRNESFFERCYDISMELAESLLSCGYYFCSKFGRTCPVQYHNKFDTFQLYLSLVGKFEIFPVIYRQYIYFLAGRKNHDKFIKNPLLYVKNKFQFPLVPFRIAIIGPPKSGKTTLAEKFNKELGLKHISIGKATRYVLKFLSYTDLAKNIDGVLRNGWQMTVEMEMKCVEAMCLEASAVALGCVFDGFPNDKEEVRQMAQLGILPHLIINLTSTKNLIHDVLKDVNETRHITPTYSTKFIDYRYENWHDSEEEFHNWLDKEYQIIGNIQVEPCKWGVWSSAYELATACLFEVRFYHVHARDDTVLSLSYMQVSSMEYVNRRSYYKEYCPCCLYDKTLTSTHNPPDRTGLVQFKYYYYCLCSDHIEIFIQDPEKYLSPYNPNKLPQELPEIVDLKELPTSNLYEDGICIVCYVEHLPKVVIEYGILDFAVKYYNNIYLFGICKCRDKFMKHPEKYFNVKINFKGGLKDELKTRDLPILGYLEQSISHDVVKAVINTANKRPLICGLSIDVSAALNVGLYLKATNNSKTNNDVLPLYVKAFNIFNKRHMELISFLKEKKERLNPFLYYQEPLLPLILPSYEHNSINTTTSIINEILNSITY